MQDNLVYDIGLHDGSDTAYYLHRGYRVVAIDANPLMVTAARRRFHREIAAGKLVLLNVAVGEGADDLPFWICDDRTEWSSFDRAGASRGGAAHHAISVQWRSLSAILAEHGTPLYMKIDIEGGDLACLHALHGRETPRYISVEAGDERLLPTLSELGYSYFQSINQRHLVPLEIPPHSEHQRLERLHGRLTGRSLEWQLARLLGGGHWLRSSMRLSRRYDGWAFPRGASGAFGEDLPGRWLSAEEAQRTFRSYQDARARGERSVLWNESPYSFWCDFHATRTAPDERRRRAVGS
jgi:FkbM family methyltransferase